MSNIKQNMLFSQKNGSLISKSNDYGMISIYNLFYLKLDLQTADYLNHPVIILVIGCWLIVDQMLRELKL